MNFVLSRSILNSGIDLLNDAADAFPSNMGFLPVDDCSFILFFRLKKSWITYGSSQSELLRAEPRDPLWKSMLPCGPAYVALLSVLWCARTASASLACSCPRSGVLSGSCLRYLSFTLFRWGACLSSIGDWPFYCEFGVIINVKIKSIFGK